jgi:hypothetical protein
MLSEVWRRAVHLFINPRYYTVCRRGHERTHFHLGSVVGYCRGGELDLSCSWVLETHAIRAGPKLERKERTKRCRRAAPRSPRSPRRPLWRWLAGGRTSGRCCLWV